MTIIFENADKTKKLSVEPNFIAAPEGEAQPMYPGMSTIESTTITIVEGEKTVSITLPRNEVVRVATILNQNF
jgi:hypothetical protein